MQERNIDWLPISQARNQGPNPQTRHVLLLSINQWPFTLWHPTNWATRVRARMLLFTFINACFLSLPATPQEDTFLYVSSREAASSQSSPPPYPILFTQLLWRLLNSYFNALHWILFLYRLIINPSCPRVHWKKSEKIETKKVKSPRSRNSSSRT